MSYTSQYKKVNEPVPWFPAAKQTSSNTGQSALKNKPKETLCPALHVKASQQYNRQQLYKTQHEYKSRHKNPYTHAQTPFYTPKVKHVQPYVNPNSVCYKYKGNQYKLVKDKYRWVKPGNEEKQKEAANNNSCDSSSVSSTSSAAESS